MQVGHRHLAVLVAFHARLLVAPVPLVVEPAGNDVLLRHAELQLRMQVLAEGRRVRRPDCGEERVVVHLVVQRVQRRAREARVDAAGDEATVAQELLEVLLVLHAQVRAAARTAALVPV